MADWQPIETAPKDGMRVTLFAQGKYGPNDTYWAISSWFDAAHPGAMEGAQSGWADWPYAIEPTHWQPLPAPPTA